MNRRESRTAGPARGIALIPLVVMVAGLAACIATIAPPAALIVPGSGNAYNPAMAVAPDGAKHIVWQECPASGGCVIEYDRTKLGEPLVAQSFGPPARASNVDPDIALSADGMVYIVWTEYYSDTSVANADAYAVLNADGGLASTAHLDPGAGQPYHTSGGRPRVAARGNNVYAAFNLAPTNGSNGGAFYRQLKPLDASSGIIELSGSALNMTFVVGRPNIAIDQNGKLHAAYKFLDCFVFTCIYAIHQADNTAGANMSTASLGDYTRAFADPDPLTSPSMAVADDNSIVIAYSTSDATDSVIYARGTSFATPFVTATVPLTGSLDPWRVAGDVHVAAVNNQPVVAFAALNNSTGGSHAIWLYASGDSTLTRITQTGDQNEPLIAAMGAPSPGEVAVVGWRTWLHFIDIHVPCLRNGYEWDQINQVVQQVYRSNGGCYSTGQAMVANQNWASAVWIDDNPSRSRLVPWLGYNANTTMLPLIMR